MSDVEVRPATPDQWRRVRALRLAALDEAPDAFWASFEEEASQPESFWRDRLSREERTTLVATVPRDDGGVHDVGLATVGRSFDDPDQAGLYGFWVAPSARGRGVGDALMAAAIAEARSMGYPRIVLDVGDHNDPAIALYERFGFEPTGRRSSFPAPRDHLTEHERALELGRR